TATFTYKVTDRGDPGAGDPRSASCTAALISAIKTVTITVSQLNDTPTASDGSASQAEDAAPISIDLRTLVDDVETSDANLTYTIVAGPTAAQGVLSTTATNGVYSFDSTQDFNGTATFTYKVTDRGDP